MYCDELEICNSLETSKGKNKLTCFYFVFGNIINRHISSLRNIFLTLIAKSSTIKQYGFLAVLAPLIADIKLLEKNGLSIDIEGQTKQIFGTIRTVSADNLEAYDLGGFRKYFNSGRICRYCMCMYNDLLIKHNESKFRLRTPLMHELHLQAIEQDRSLIRAYGVVSKCSLSDLVGFSPATAFPPDIMHDCLEGVIPVFLHYLFNDLAQNNLCTFTIK